MYCHTTPEIIEMQMLTFQMKTSTLLQVNYF